MLKGRSWARWVSLAAALVVFVGAGVVIFQDAFWPGEDEDRESTGDSERSITRVRPTGPSLSGSGASNAPTSGPPSPAPDLETPLSQAKGRVVAAADGRPIDGAFVFAASTTGWAISSDEAVTTGPDGAFELPVAVDTAGVTLVAVANGYRRASLEHVTGQEALIQLSSGSSIVGTVVDLSGTPVEGVVIWAARPENQACWPHTDGRFLAAATGDGAITQSREDGTFSLTGLAEGVAYVVRCSKKDYVTRQPGAMIRTKAGDEIQVVLRPLSTVVIRAKSDSGEMLPAGAISLNMRVPIQFDGTAPAPVDPMGLVSKPPEGGLVLRLAQVRSAKGRAAQAWITLRVPGHKPKTVELSLARGTLILPVIVLDREDPEADLVRTRIALRLPNERPCIGRFLCELVTPSSRFEVNVGSEGKEATLELPLPPAEYGFVVLNGVSKSTATYWPKKPQMHAFTVDGGVLRTTIPIQIRADEVLLEVFGPDGNRVRGFDLRLSGEAARLSPPWILAWDVRSPGQPVALDDATLALVAEGESVLSANVTNTGGGSVSILATGDGNRLRARLQLHEGAADQIPVVPPDLPR